MGCNRWIVLLAVLFSIVVIIFILSFSSRTTPTTVHSRGSRTVDTLKFVVVVSRHGNRRFVTIPNDPYPLNDTRYWKYKLGELTTVGRVQMFNLGNKFRGLYNSFLNATYLDEEFYASSTELSRTMMSGEVFLAGLYPPTGYQVWNKNLLWQPIPLYINSLDKSVVIHNTDCPRYKTELDKFPMQNLTMDNPKAEEISKYLKKFTGSNHSEVWDFIGTWDTFASEDAEGYKLPEWAQKVYPHPMEDIAKTYYIAAFSGTDNIARLMVGPFFQEIIKLMNNKTCGALKPDRKMHYYSGHDSSLIALQYILGIPKPSISLVKPGASMIFELHQDPATQHFLVKVLYIDGPYPESKPKPINIPGCGFSCDFNKLMKITERFWNIPDWKEDCKLDS